MGIPPTMPMESAAMDKDMVPLALIGCIREAFSTRGIHFAKDGKGLRQVNGPAKS